MHGFEDLFLNSTENIRKAIQVINEGKYKIALVVNENNSLVGTITDGDIRRGILSGYKLDEPSTLIMRKDFRYIRENSKTQSKEFLDKDKLNLIPVLDSNDRVIEIILKNNFERKEYLDNDVIIMAGGKGTRLGSMTKNIPKPMLEIAGKPMIDIVIENCIEAGFFNFHVSVNYLKSKIKNHLCDGKNKGIKIDYLEEKFSMGTGGSLSLFNPKKLKPILVINSDVLTKVDLRNLITFHNNNKSSITICCRELETSLSYGIIKTKGSVVSEILEKPVFKHNVNAGIYLINPDIINLIPKNKFQNMTDIISLAIRNKRRVKVFPIHEYWLDVGIPETFKKANGEW